MNNNLQDGNDLIQDEASIEFAPIDAKNNTYTTLFHPSGNGPPNEEAWNIAMDAEQEYLSRIADLQKQIIEKYALKLNEAYRLGSGPGDESSWDHKRQIRIGEEKDYRNILYYD
jgi:hypothetical protein